MIVYSTIYSRNLRIKVTIYCEPSRFTFWEMCPMPRKQDTPALEGKKCHYPIFTPFWRVTSDLWRPSPLFQRHGPRGDANTQNESCTSGSQWQHRTWRFARKYGFSSLRYGLNGNRTQLTSFSGTQSISLYNLAVHIHVFSTNSTFPLKTLNSPENHLFTPHALYGRITTFAKIFSGTYKIKQWP